VNTISFWITNINLLLITKLQTDSGFAGRTVHTGLDS